MATSDQLHDFLRHTVLGQPSPRLVLDFAEVTFMDSSGLGVLMLWFKQLREQDGQLSVAAVRRSVETVLRISAVDQVLGVYDTVESAEAAMPPVVP